MENLINKQMTVRVDIGMIYLTLFFDLEMYIITKNIRYTGVELYNVSKDFDTGFTRLYIILYAF